MSITAVKVMTITPVDDDRVIIPDEIHYADCVFVRRQPEHLMLAIPSFVSAKEAAKEVDLYEQIPVQKSMGFVERSTIHKALDDRREQQERAKRTGFTGNACSTCGGTRMMRNGSCESCADCGTTTGCG